MGGLKNFLPFTYSAMLVGSLSLVATPYLTGFYSKDLIIELAYAQYNFSGTYAFILGTITAGITAFYSVRLLSLVFFSVPNGPKASYLNSHEANLAVIVPLFILALFSIGFGYIGSDLFVGVGTDFFANSIFIHPNNVTIIEAEFSMNPIVKQLPLIFTIIGATSAFIIYNYMPTITVDITESYLGRRVYSFLNGKYYFDIVYNNYIIGFGLKLGYIVSKVLDRGVIELVGPYGLSNVLSKTGENLSKLDTGIITTYALYIVISLLVLILVLFGSVLFDYYVISPRLLIVLFFILIVLAFDSNKNTSSTPPPFIDIDKKKGGHYLNPAIAMTDARFLFIRQKHTGRKNMDVLFDKFSDRFDIFIMNVLSFIVVSIIVVCLGFVFYILNLYEFAYYKYLVMVCSYIFTFGFTLVISNIVKWSDNYFIRTIQKSIFYTILCIIIWLFMAFFGIDFSSFFSVLYLDTDDEDEGGEVGVGIENSNTNENKVDKGKGKEGKILSIVENKEDGTYVITVDKKLLKME